MKRILHQWQLERLFLHREAFQSPHPFLCSLVDGSWIQFAETNDKLPPYLSYIT